MTATKKRSSQKYDYYSVPIHKNQRPANAKRLINAYARGMGYHGALKGLMNNFARQFTSNEEDQEEIISRYGLNLLVGGARTYRYLIHKNEELASNPRFLGWTKVCLYNAFRERLRFKNRSKSKNLTELFINDPDDEDYSRGEKLFLIEGKDPVQELCRKEEEAITQDFVDEELGKLDEQKRDILKLYYFDDLSYLEISEALGIPVGTVKSRLHEAKRKFSELERVSSLLN